ncbi:MAG TPA: BatA domain-containing protein [Candidatus Binataceae bacterium]|nr:BatA domain-containing protein [Candidatus Binataceae bacterium]
MGFFYPGALALFALTPLLLVAYLTRERPRRVRISSVMAYRALGATHSKRFGGRPWLDWLFFVELLILCLAVLAAAGPYVVHRDQNFAVVLDNSAAMQARTPDGSTRFVAAVAHLRQLLGEQHFPARVTVYVSAPQPHQLAAPLSSFAAARRALAAVNVTDASSDPGALKDLMTGLLADRRLNGVYYAGAYAVAQPTPPRLVARPFDAPLANGALGSFTLRRESFASPTLHAHVAVANFGPAPQTFTVTVSAGKTVLARAETHLAADEIGALDFPSLRTAEVYKAQLEPADGFPLDNTAWATAGAVRAISVLFVSPAPGDAKGLDRLPGVKVITRRPDAYTPQDLTSADVAIFEYAVPKELPGVNTLLVMPPPDDPVFGFTIRPAARLSITGWNTTDPLTDAVNFRLLNPRLGEFFGVHRWMKPVATGPSGALVMRGVRNGHRFVATGFNPFPYLGRKNLPMSILTLNMLSYLAGLGSESGGLRTGQPWQVPAGIERIVLPSGSAIDVTAGTVFTDTAAQGVYQLVSAGGEKNLRAVNLDDLGVSDLAHAPRLHLEGPGGGGFAQTLSVDKAPLTADLLDAILVLAMLEAVVIYRRRRAPMAAS